ncbi:hypothetical protein BHE74_00054134, partial [Ensete ventricosum]
VSEACWEFTGSWPKGSKACRKLAEGIGSLLGVRRELTEGDRELARMASGVRRKKTKRLAGRSSEVAEKLTESQESLVGLRFFDVCTVGERQLYWHHPGFRAAGGGCTAQPDGCTITAQESEQQATIGPPKPIVVPPISYFQGGFQWLYRRHRRLYRP